MGFAKSKTATLVVKFQMTSFTFTCVPHYYLQRMESKHSNWSIGILLVLQIVRVILQGVRHEGRKGPGSCLWKERLKSALSCHVSSIWKVDR